MLKRLVSGPGKNGAEPVRGGTELDEFWRIQDVGRSVCVCVSVIGAECVKQGGEPRRNKCVTFWLLQCVCVNVCIVAKCVSSQ